MKMIWCVLTMFGCGVDSAAEPFAPEAVTTGIYAITTTRSADGCDPPRFAGTGQVGLYRTVVGLELYDRGATVTAEYALTADDGYALRIPPSGQHLDPCGAAPGDSVVFDYALASASADRVDVVKEETWVLTSPCASPNNSSTVPTSSCHATLSLRYDLVQACAPPCRIASDVPDAYTCTC